MGFFAKFLQFFHRAPAEPVALQMLHDFSHVAAKIDAFKAQPNEGARYLYYTQNAPWPTNEYMGITPGWLNAVEYEGELNGQPVSNFRGDPTTAIFTWAHSMPPGYYVPPATIADGRTVLTKFLADMANASPYLRSLGLTQEAIANTAAR